MVRRLRKQTDVPLLLMMYLNTIFCYGTDRFFAECRKAALTVSLFRISRMRKKMRFRAALTNITSITSAW